MIYYAPFVAGGLADYARHQASAIADCGVQVELLAPAELLDKLPSRSDENLRRHVLPPSYKLSGANLLSRGVNLFAASAGGIRQLCRLAEHHKPDCILFGAYAEYFAPLWSSQLRRLRSRGIRIGSVVHDPVRDFVVGPKLWHRWSVSHAYSFLDVAFVHEYIDLDTGWPKRKLVSVEIPHGIYNFPHPVPLPSKHEARELLELPGSAVLYLAFGHIRDGKNLDLVLRAMTSAPNMHLVIAGKEQSTSQRPVEYYRQIAEQLGIADRCHWRHEYIDQAQAWKYFVASDYLLLTYSSDFRSASGILNVAAQFDRPVIASSGAGPLMSAMHKYQIGLSCRPDDLDALRMALRASEGTRYEPHWMAYRQDHSWQRNAEICIQQLKS